jgi:pimeloyl-ACP methyl ester carboxylesterase
MSTVVGRLAHSIAGSPLRAALLVVLLAAASALMPSFAAGGDALVTKPTIVLVHGAFAESASWDKVSSRLLAKGYAVVAAANPLRSVKRRRRLCRRPAGLDQGSGHPRRPFLRRQRHHRGGDRQEQRQALVYVAGLAPDVGETAAALSGKFPGSTLGDTLATPVVLADGSKDLYIQQDKYQRPVRRRRARCRLEIDGDHATPHHGGLRITRPAASAA